ncbi:MULTISPECIES: hypothetical protein [unclassified Corynebacterium]|uniref:hypothetical protein n=1 Tax=unclassified Corynebacterium TaxID=2624378 RepID=UPI0035258618
MANTQHFYISLGLMILALLSALFGLTAWTAIFLVILIAWSAWGEFGSGNIVARGGAKSTPNKKPRVR